MKLNSNENDQSQGSAETESAPVSPVDEVKAEDPKEKADRTEAKQDAKSAGSAAPKKSFFHRHRKLIKKLITLIIILAILAVIAVKIIIPKFFSKNTETAVSTQTF